MVVLRKSAVATGDFGGTKLSLLLEKQHNRGQDGAGAAILSANPEPGETPYWIAKSASATPLTDVLGMIGKRDASRRDAESQRTDLRVCAPPREKIFLGHLRYATFGKNDTAFCHPFVHESSDLAHTLLLAGNFNLTNAHELFDDYRHRGSFPTSKSDGYLITSLIAKQLEEERSPRSAHHISKAVSAALANADGAWTLCGMTADGWAFATRDPHGIRPGWRYIDDDVVVVASERAAIQAAFDVPPEAVKELPPGETLVISPEGKVEFCELDRQQADVESPRAVRHCSFERIYFSRANDADIHRERKALGAALVPRILEAANAPMDRIFFSYIPNSARIAFHGLLEELFKQVVAQSRRGAESVLSLGRCPRPQESCPSCQSCPKTLRVSASLREISLPRFGEVAVKDAKFRTFIADAAARREFYKHVYDVTYGLVKKDDTLVVLDDSIVRGNTMKNAILPMLDRLGPKRIVIASSAPPIRYPDCYGIDMSTLGELVAFKALVNLLGKDADRELSESLAQARPDADPLAPLYARFSDREHAAEIARLLTPPGMKADVVVVYQPIEDLHKALSPVPHSPFPVPRYGDWYFTGDYPTPGGYKVLHKALLNYLARKNERSY